MGLATGQTEAYGSSLVICYQVNLGAQFFLGTSRAWSGFPFPIDCLLMCSDNGGINRNIGVVGVGQQYLKDAFPYPSLGPAGKAFTDTLPVAILRWQVLSVSATAQDPQHPIDEPAVVLSIYSH
jgi:hypothetical protein